MIYPRTGKLLVFAALILLGAGLLSPLWAYQLEIRGDKISIDAYQVPMRELLRQLSDDYGVTVKIDPDINPLISVSFKNRALEDGLKAILKPHNHIFIWKARAHATDGTPNPGYQLDEVLIFKPGQRDRMVDIQGPPDAEPEGEAETDTEPDAEPLAETRVIIKNNKVFVPVTLGFGSNTIETSLIFDTGAGSIVLHADVAQQLGIDQGRVSQGEGVGGIRIDTRTSKLNFVQVGPHKKEDLRVDVIAYAGPADADYNGLLGMNFIRGLKYTIDFENQVIRWLP